MTDTLIITATIPLPDDIMHEAALITGLAPAIEEFKAALRSAGLPEETIIWRREFGTSLALAVAPAPRRKRGPNKPRVTVEHDAGE